MVALGPGEAMPTNAKGVVVRGALEAAVRDRADALDADVATGGGGGASAKRADARDVARAVLDEVEALTGHRLAADAPLLGARGLNSAGVVHLAAALSTRLGARVAPARIFDFPSAAALARALAGRPEESRESPRAARDRAPRTATFRAAALSFGGGVGNAAALGAAVRWSGDAAGGAPLARWDAWPVASRRLRAAAYGAFFADGAKLFRFDCDRGLGLSVAEARVADPQTFLVLDAGARALRDAGVARGARNVGVFTALMGSDAAALRGRVEDVRSPYELSGCGRGATQSCSTLRQHVLDNRLWV